MEHVGDEGERTPTLLPLVVHVDTADPFSTYPTLQLYVTLHEPIKHGLSPVFDAAAPLAGWLMVQGSAKELTIKKLETPADFPPENKQQKRCNWSDGRFLPFLPPFPCFPFLAFFKNYKSLNVSSQQKKCNARFLAECSCGFADVLVAYSDN